MERVHPSRAALIAYATERQIELLFFDPPRYFDHAIVGLVYGFGQEPVVLYDEDKVLRALARDMGEEGARDWFGFNTVGAWVGSGTPRFLLHVEGVR